MLQRRPRLILVDDHAMMLEGLKVMLEPDHDIVAMVSNGKEVCGAVEGHRPDVVLLDISLPGRSGLEIAAEIRRRFPETKVLIVTMHAERIYADEALKVGASGYVLKLARTEEVRHAIVEVMAGRQYVTPLLTELAAIAESKLMPRGVPDGVGMEALTDRQREVLLLIAKGRTTAEIAERLGVSSKSVEFHRAKIKTVLGLRSTAALVRYAVGEGLV